MSYTYTFTKKEDSSYNIGTDLETKKDLVISEVEFKKLASFVLKVTGASLEVDAKDGVSFVLPKTTVQFTNVSDDIYSSGVDVETKTQTGLYTKSEIEVLVDLVKRTKMDEVITIVV